MAMTRPKLPPRCCVECSRPHKRNASCFTCNGGSRSIVDTRLFHVEQTRLDLLERRPDQKDPTNRIRDEYWLTPCPTWNPGEFDGVLGTQPKYELTPSREHAMRPAHKPLRSAYRPGGHEVKTARYHRGVLKVLATNLHARERKPLLDFRKKGRLPPRPFEQNNLYSRANNLKRQARKPGSGANVGQPTSSNRYSFGGKLRFPKVPLQDLHGIVASGKVNLLIPKE